MQRTAAYSLIASVVIFHGYCQWQMWADYRSHWFPTVDGTVTVSEIEGTGNQTLWRLEYEYRVEGTDYVGREVRPNFPSARMRERTANSRVRQYPVGKPVTVWYDPESPRSARLEPGTTWHPGAAWVLLFAQVVLLGFVTSAVYPARDHSGFNVTDGRFVSPERGQLVVRVPPVNPGWCLRPFGAGWFAATFLYLFGVGQVARPDNFVHETVGLVYGHVAGCVLLVVQLLHFRNALAWPFVRLDLDGRTVWVHSRWRRPVGVPFAAVTSVLSVPLTRAVRGKPGTWHQVQLRCVSLQPLVLAEFEDWRDADLLATWLWVQVSATTEVKHPTAPVVSAPTS